MRAKKIKCERCQSESGDLLVDPPHPDRAIEFYQEEDGRIHCEACVDGEVEIEGQRSERSRTEVVIEVRMSDRMDELYVATVIEEQIRQMWGVGAFSGAIAEGGRKIDALDLKVSVSTYARD